MKLAGNKQLTGADAEFGYRFGCDGLMTVQAVCDHIGRCRMTVSRMVDRGVFRKGKDPDTGRVSICRRSVDQYVESIQE